MSVEKFLEDLKFLLSDLPEEEREEALDFYRYYFEDAGDENLEGIFAELGSPEKVAYTIREGLKDKEDEGEFTETGYRTYEDISAPATRYAHKEEKSAESYEFGHETSDGFSKASDMFNKASDKFNKASDRVGEELNKAKQKFDEKRVHMEDAKNRFNEKRGNRSNYTQPKKRRNPVAAFFMAILKILMVIAAIVIVILLICAFCALLAVLIASLVATVALLVSGIGTLATGMGLVGAAMIGLTFVSLAVFVLLLMAFVAFCKKGLAGGIRGITSLTGDVVHERRRNERKGKEA